MEERLLLHSKVEGSFLCDDMYVHVTLISNLHFGNETIFFRIYNSFIFSVLRSRFITNACTYISKCLVAIPLANIEGKYLN